MTQKYKNIPVKPDVYTRVRLVADANHRGLGDQVAAWAEQELPECDHEKEPVPIETFPSATNLAKSVVKPAYYCPTCKRVYAPVDEPAEPVHWLTTNE